MKGKTRRGRNPRNSKRKRMKTFEKERKYFEREKVYKNYSDEKESNGKKLKGKETIKVVIN